MDAYVYVSVCARRALAFVFLLALAALRRVVGTQHQSANIVPISVLKIRNSVVAETRFPGMTFVELDSGRNLPCMGSIFMPDPLPVVMVCIGVQVQ